MRMYTNVKNNIYHPCIVVEAISLDSKKAIVYSKIIRMIYGKTRSGHP